MYTEDHAKIMEAHSGRKYRPSNGTEGEMFMSTFCSRCKHDNLDPETCTDGCNIIAETMAFDVTDDDYPKEWIIASDGQPTCTAFELATKEPQ